MGTTAPTLPMDLVPGKVGDGGLSSPKQETPLPYTAAPAGRHFNEIKPLEANSFSPMQTCYNFSE